MPRMSGERSLDRTRGAGEALETGPARELSAFDALFRCKVVECQRKAKHPWEDCIYCHPRENARRRDLTKHRYAAEPCPDYAKDEYCELGDDCPYAHGTFEVHLHPAKYCTKMCTKGANCTRKICFFAHTESELRDPDYSYGPKSADEALLVKQQLMAERAQQILADQARQQELNLLEQWQNNMRRAGDMASLTSLSSRFPNTTEPQLPFLGSASTLGSLPIFGLDTQPATPAFRPGVFPPAALDIAAINRDNAHLFPALDSAGFGSGISIDDSMTDCQSLAASPLSSLSMFSRTSPQSKSPRSASTAPRMSVRKARELGIEPKKQPRTGASPGSRATSLPPFMAPTQQSIAKPPSGKMSPLKAPMADLGMKEKPSSASTRLVSPEGVKLTIDQAVRMIQFIDATNSGNLTVAVQQVDFLTAMTRLKAMGWTTCQVEEMEESASSGNSSPDRLSFGSQQQNKTFSHGISTPLPTFDGSLAPQPQHATVLSGSGLDFSPVRSAFYSLFS